MKQNASKPPKIGIPGAPRVIRLCIIRKFPRELVTALIAVILLLAPVDSLRAQPLSNEARLSVLTMLAGEDLYSGWGHTAIRVVDEPSAIDYTFNFGTFDFTEPNFYPRFLMGRLDYKLAIEDYARILVAYRYHRRTIIEQQLRLTQEEVQQAFDLLMVNYRPENRAYRYDFFFDNCSTRPRDILEHVLGLEGRLGIGLSGEDTFRKLTVDQVSDRTWAAFGIDILLSLPTERRATGRERLFLPEEVLAALDNELDSGQEYPLVMQKDTVLWFPNESGELRFVFRPGFVLWLFSALVILLSLLYRKKATPAWFRRFDAVLVLIVGVAGTIMFFLLVASEHTALKPNLNIIWAWPTHIFAAVCLLRKTPSVFFKWYAFLYCIVAATAIVSWEWLPQQLPNPLVPLVLMLAVRFFLRAGEVGARTP